MASANVTIGDDGGEFEADSTARVATLTTPGGVVRNTSASQTIYIAPNKAASATSAAGGAGQLCLKAGAAITLPRDCKTFGFVASASGFFNVEKG